MEMGFAQHGDEVYHGDLVFRGDHEHAHGCGGHCLSHGRARYGK